MFGNTHIDGKTMKNKTVTSQVRTVSISRDFWAVGNTLFLGLNGDYMETHFLNYSLKCTSIVDVVIYIYITHYLKSKNKRGPLLVDGNLNTF